MAITRILFVCLLVSLALCCSGENQRPIIGIVSEPVDGTDSESYIAASYVKFIESAGARVVPILVNSTTEQLTHLFQSINGVLFPGGSVSLNKSSYLNVGQTIFNLAMQANDKGDYFPLWGTCLGFELLLVLAAQDSSVLTPLDAENYPIPLNLQDPQFSRLFSFFSNDSLQWIQSENITMNNHAFGVTVNNMYSHWRLRSFYDVLSRNYDRNNIEFVSTIEAFSYPFYGVQWHPEKNTFEWTLNENIPHSDHATAISQTAADFFVQEARKSNHSFANATEEYISLIYNYIPTYTAADSSFVQQYYFK